MWKATDREVELMGNIVKRLRFREGKYRSEAYPNPGKIDSLELGQRATGMEGTDYYSALAYHYAQLQSLAFEEDFDSAIASSLDKAIPKYQGMHKAAGDFMKEFNLEIGDDERAVGSVAKPGKRAAAAVDVSHVFPYNLDQEPQRKLMNEIDESDLADVEGLWKKGQIEKVSFRACTWSKQLLIPL